MLNSKAPHLLDQKNKLKPWQKEQYCIPPEASAEFVCSMEDILDVYKRPYDPKYPVVCMDEKPKQLISEKRTPIPARPGRVERFDYEYTRSGVANIFIAFEPLANVRDIKVTKRRTKKDWAKYMQELSDVNYPEAEKIILVMDNLNTHKPASFYETFEPVEAKRLIDRFEFHYTPKHGSWLNMAEIELSVLSRHCLDQRFGDIDILKFQTSAWVSERNIISASVNWQFTTDDARIKLRRLYPSIDE
ncbi:MAG: IS630 family transposase [Actinobacteria bacterium]|nr:IS630 family transposase [Actinomycetota bacterium]